jgi:hypothetical protein
MMKGRSMRKLKFTRESGNVVGYLLIAVFLTGLLIAAMSKGAKKSVDTSQIDQLMLFLQGDIKTIQSTISECAQGYSKAVDVNNNGVINAADNPNVPFPLYSDLSSGGVAGETVTAIKCPGAPTAQQTIFNANAGNYFKALSDTATYTTKYFTDATEGVYLRITRASSDPLWTEAIARLDTKYSECSAAAVTAVGACANGCFYFWIVRLGTSTLGGEVGCP